jgi:opacity protein-like surface antigen
MRYLPAALPMQVATIALGLLWLAAPASHADPLGLYIGAGIGEAQVKVDAAGFNEHHAGWKALVGLRPISVFGAELEYIDFGHPSASPFGSSTDAHVRASALSALLFAPLPVPDFDVYAKAGFSRLQSTGSTTRPGVGSCTVTVPNCALFSFDRTDTRFAFGAGAQLKFSALALRAEYQRFRSDLGDPAFWSLALTWGF